MAIYVDGVLDASAASGPTGDVSYPDDGVPLSNCGGPCTNSDPFIVIVSRNDIILRLSGDNTLIIITEDAFGGLPYDLDDTDRLTYLGPLIVAV